MFKRKARIIAVFVLIVMVLSTASTAMASLVTFRHTNLQITRFDRNSVDCRVGPGRTNTIHHVSIVQAAHNSYSHLSPRLDVDGKCGPATQSGIIRLQSAIGATTDGVIGPDSWKVLHDKRGSSVYSQGLPFIW
jgi:peptidoglycan hydrolase-like protein with peptidoglycan-binding domain